MIAAWPTHSSVAFLPATGHINLFIERGPALGPVLEVAVDSVEEAKRRLVKNGCEIIKDEPDFPRCYVKDPFGLIYNLTR